MPNRVNNRITVDLVYVSPPLSATDSAHAPPLGKLLRMRLPVSGCRTDRSEELGCIAPQRLPRAMVSIETLHHTEDRLTGNSNAAIRKDNDETLPVRGFVLCDDCGKPLTACCSQSKTGKRYPYYWCKTTGCVSARRSIAKHKLEGDVENLLPLTSLVQELATFLRKVWRTQEDSNLWPLPSEGSALSS